METLWIEYLGYAHAHLPGPTECQAGSFPTGEGSPEAASPVSGRTDIRTSGKCEFPWADPECKLCMTADHVRKHIDGAISAYEAAVASARQELTTQIDNAAPGGALDAKAFLDEYSKRKTFYYVPEDLADQDEKLLVWLNSLCDRQRWTFEDADKVRELCRIRAKGKSHWLESYEQENRFDHLVGKLTQEMKNAANRCGLAEIWDWYDSAKQRLNEGEIKKVRRILGRHNPEAMFRELEEEFGGPLMGTIISHRLPGITKWGYDPKFVDKTVKTATKLISREGEDEFDRELHRELRTMQALVRRERRGA